VITEFLDAWPLFRDTWVASWLLAALLAVVGVFVVVRDQVFVGAAIAQASTFGIALGLCLGSEWAAEGSFFRSDAFLSIAAVAFAVVAALVTARVGRGGGEGGGSTESHEAITGFVFLACSSAALLLIAHSPHGLDDVERLLASSGIGATVGDVVVLAILCAATLAFVFARRRELLLFAIDPATARALGVRRRSDVLASAWIGLALGLAMRVSGVLYSFGCLVLPALISKSLCPAALPMFLAAPLIALFASVAAAFLGHALDFNQAQLAVALLCAMLAGAWLRRG
jgi:ABC-type Mn2+/Zn2+ transport system permease subunit